MYTVISNGLKPLYYLLRLTGLLNFKLDTTGNFIDMNSYLLAVTVINATLTIVCTYFCTRTMLEFRSYNSLTVHLLSISTIVGGISIIVTDIIRFVNRRKISNIWSDIFLLNDIYADEKVKLNYNLIQYTGYIIIWVQFLIRILTSNLVAKDDAWTTVFDLWIIILVISYLRNSVTTVEFVILRLVVASYFNNFVILLQRINAATRHLKRNKLFSLYFNLCRLSKNVDCIASPQIITKLFESFLALNILIYHVISLTLYLPEDRSTLTGIIVFYMILDSCVTIAYVILPVHLSIKNVSVLYIMLKQLYFK